MSNPNSQKPALNNLPAGSPPAKASANASKGISPSSSTHKASSKSTSVPISKLIEAERHIQQQQQRMQQAKQPQRIKPTPAPLHSHLPKDSSGSPGPIISQKVLTSHGSRESSKLPELMISPGKPSTSNSSRSSTNSSRAGTTSTSSESVPTKKRLIEVGKSNVQHSSAAKPSQSKTPQTTKIKASQKSTTPSAKSEQLKKAATPSSAKSDQSKKTASRSDQQKTTASTKTEQQKTASAKTEQQKATSTKTDQQKSASTKSEPQTKESTKANENQKATIENSVHLPSTNAAKENPSPKPPSKSTETPAPRVAPPKQSSTTEKVGTTTETTKSSETASQQEKPKEAQSSTSQPPNKEQQAVQKVTSTSQQKAASDSTKSSETKVNASQQPVHKPDELPQQPKPAPHPQSNNSESSKKNQQQTETTKPSTSTTKENEQAKPEESKEKQADSTDASPMKANELSTTATLSLSSAIQGAVTSASTEPDIDIDVENEAIQEKEHHSNLPKRKKEPDVPMSEMADEMKTKTFNISTLFRMTFSDVKIELTPDFRDLEEKEFNTMFINKVKECKKICDWSIGIKDVEAKKNKKILLIQLIELFESKNGLDQIQPQSINKFISMVVQNISRPFPPQKIINPLFDFDDVTQDMAWPHLALVYEALLKLLMSPINVKVKHPTFVSVLAKNSCSPDERERMAVRDNLKLLFVKCPDLQDTILRLVQNQFLTGICSHQILEFILAVLDEVGRPLPESLVNMYKNSILFLHSSKMFLSFYKAFFAVVNRFVRFERSLLQPTIEYLVKHWPSSTVRKQLVFMSEMEGLTLNYFEDVNEEIAKMVFTKLSDLVNQPNIDIAETALNVLLGPALEEPLINYPELAIKILTQELMNAANKNWNDYVQEDSKLALQMLSDLNPKIFKSTVSKLKEERKKKKTYQGIWRTNWKKVVESAKINDSTITSANMDMLF